ncbi:MAG: class I SAM-dependent methyltransferase [Reyranellaceae bacterium]
MESAEYDALDRLEERMWWYRGLHRQMDAALRRLLPALPAGPLLDAGCGTGGLLAFLRGAAGPRPRLGVEIHPAAALRARGKSGAAIAAGSLNALPLADRSVAAVLSADVLCHARVDPEVALREIARVLRPGGYAVFNLPAYDWLRSAHDARVHNARRFTATGFAGQLRQAGLAPLRSTYWNSFLLPLMVLRRLFERGHTGKSDVMEYPAAINALFGAILGLERGLIALGLRLPAGGSLLVVARKNA